MEKASPKTLEETIREKFATGYDPIKLDVHARAINEANIEVKIAGHTYSVVDNNISLIEKKSAEFVGPQQPAEEIPADPAHPVNGGDSGNPEENAPVGNDPDTTEEAKTNSSGDMGAPDSDVTTSDAGTSGE